MTLPGSTTAQTLLCALTLACGMLHAGPAGAQSSPVRQAFERGAAAMRAGQGAAAEAAFREAIALAPDMAEAHLDLGLVLAREGKLDPAIASLQQAVALDPMQNAAHMFLGIFLFQTNHPQEARRALETATTQDPRNAEAFTWLGNVDLAMGHPERAVVSFDKAAELTPNDLNLLELRGRAHNQVAHESYARMAKLDPNSWHVHRVQAQLFSDEGKHADAITEYQAALKLEPRNPDLYEALGDEFRAVSRLDAAQTAYVQELALAPANPVAMYNVGSVDVDRGNDADGVPLLLRFTQLYPGSPVAEYFLGRGLASLGRNDEAATWLRKSAASSTDGEIAKRSWYELARVEQKLHRTADAQTAVVAYNRIRALQESNSTHEIQDWRKLGRSTAELDPAPSGNAAHP